MEVMFFESFALLCIHNNILLGSDVDYRYRVDVN